MHKSSLGTITLKTIEKAIGEFMIAYRPINPITKNTNSFKNVYTKFVPYNRMDEPTTIISPKEIDALGQFKVV